MLAMGLNYQPRAMGLESRSMSTVYANEYFAASSGTAGSSGSWKEREREKLHLTC